MFSSRSVLKTICLVSWRVAREAGRRRPSRAALLEMMTSPEYSAINVDRENGVEDHVILIVNQTYSKLVSKPAPA